MSEPESFLGGAINTVETTFIRGFPNSIGVLNSKISPVVYAIALILAILIINCDRLYRFTFSYLFQVA